MVVINCERMRMVVINCERMWMVVNICEIGLVWFGLDLDLIWFYRHCGLSDWLAIQDWYKELSVCLCVIVYE